MKPVPTKLLELVREIDERNVNPNSTVLSVSERYGIVPQTTIYNKKIALDDLSNYKAVKYGDIVFNPYLLWNSAVGACLIEQGGCTSPAYKILRPIQSGTEYFLHYFFRSDRLAAEVDAIATGSVTRRRTAPVSDILNLEFVLPEIQAQRDISKFLAAVDNLIGINVYMSKTLESMARAMFHQWFVDDEDVGSWEVGKLGDFMKVNERSITKDYLYNEIEYIDISSVSPGRLVGTTTYALKDAPSRAKRLVRHGDTIWSTVRPNRKSFLFIDNPKENLVVSTGFAVLTPKKIPPSFLYFLTTTEKFVDYLVSNADGSAYPAVLPDKFSDSEFSIPPNDVLNKFESIASLILVQIAHNEKESRTLASLRDSLLPKLMRGEVRVKS